MQNSLHFRKSDIVAIALVLLSALVVFLCFLPGDDAAAYAQVYQNGDLLHTLPMDQPRELVISDTYTNTITIRDRKIAITCSDCPGEDCVASGWLDSTGRSIVCLPNALEIRVVSDSSDVDFVVG